MLKYSKLILLFAIALIQCGDNTTLQVVFEEHPQGGNNITTLECVLRGRLAYGNTPITASVEWWWEDISHLNDTCLWSEEWTFEDTAWQNLNTYYSAPSGYILLHHYWVKVVWGDGYVHESDIAWCY